jgi:hypothetical protein
MESSKLPKLRASFRKRHQQSTLARRRRPTSARFLARARSPAQAQHRRLRPFISRLTCGPMPRARRKKRGFPSKPWRTILKKANTGAKVRTNVRDRAAARRATLVVRARTPVRVTAGAPRTGASLRQHSSDDLETCSVKVKSLKTMSFTLNDLRPQKHESFWKIRNYAR